MSKTWNVSLGLIGQINVNGVEAPTRWLALVRAEQIANQYLSGPRIVPDDREHGVHVETLAARTVIDAGGYCSFVHAEELVG